MNFSVSEENYIKSIYHLQQDHQIVSTNALAAELATKPASVTDMLKKLQQKKLLQYERYKGFKLNASGNRIALTIIRKHRLWECFLVIKLGFEWDQVHDIAEELEHVSSEALIQKLDHYLDYPQIDPHGDPIPGSDGKMPLIRQTSIAKVALNKQVVVSSVSNQSNEMLEMLKHYHIGIGTKLKVNKRFEFDGSIEIKVNKQADCIISAQMANHIFVHHD